MSARTRAAADGDVTTGKAAQHLQLKFRWFFLQNFTLSSHWLTNGRVYFKPNSIYMLIINTAIVDSKVFFAIVKAKLITFHLEDFAELW